MASLTGTSFSAPSRPAVASIPRPVLGFGHIEQFEAFVIRDGKIVEHTMTVLRMVPPSEAP